MIKKLVLLSMLGCSTSAFSAPLDTETSPHEPTQQLNTATNPQNVIKERLTRRLKKDLYIKPLQGTSLYVVVVDDNVLFTDSEGSVLINGDILSLSENILVSKVEKEEFEALRRKAKIVAESKVDNVSSFITKSDLSATSTAQSVANSQQNELQSDSHNTVTKPVSSFESATASALGYTPEQVDFEQTCLSKIKGKKDLMEITTAFQEDMSSSERIQCGQVFAKAVINNLPDTEFIHYKAANPKAFVTIFSDYTCSFCLREHNQISTLLEQGISVKVYPYIRNYYRERVTNKDGSLRFGEYTTQGKNLAAVQCSAEDNEERKRLFDMLMNSPNSYTTKVLDEFNKVALDGKCVEASHRQKLYGDLFTGRGTPLHVFSNGLTHRGYLTPEQLIDKAI